MDLKDIIIQSVYKTDEFRAVQARAEKNGPWMMDFKGVSLDVDFLKAFATEFWKKMAQTNTIVEGSVHIGGMEAGALPLIATIALFAPSEIHVHTFFIRKSRKKHDMANLVEGKIYDNSPIILVDDILNRGSTFKKQIKILDDIGHPVKAVLAVIRFRDLQYYRDLTEKGIQVHSLFDLSDFSNELGLTNMTAGQAKAPTWDAYEAQYKLELGASNPYLVVPKSAPALAGEHLYMGSDDGTFYCFNTVTGKTVWSYKITFGAQGKRILSSPAVFRDTVVWGGYDGNVYCFDRFTGKKKWVFFDADWVGSSPCIDETNGVMYIGLEFGLWKKRGGVVAIDIKSGKAIWKYYEMEGLTHASPAFSSKHNLLVCGCNDNFLYAFNATTGKLLWKFRTEGEIKASADFDDVRDIVCFGSFDGHVYALHVKTGELYAKFAADFGFYSTPLVTNNTLIIGSLDKKVYCYNLDSKSIVWTFLTNGRIFSSPLLLDHSLYIGSNDGRLYELDPHTGKNQKIIQLSERIVNKICAERTDTGQKVLFIPTHANELFKYIEK